MKPNEATTIPGFEGRYAVTLDGRIFDSKTQRYKPTHRLPKGYNVVSIGGKSQLVSRLMGVTFLGLTQHLQMDHINGDASDDRLENLRVCTFAQNQQNKGLHRNNRSGHVGVFWKKSSKRWLAKIEANKVRYWLGEFKTFEEAVAAYQGARTTLHGQFKSTQR